MSIDNPTTPTPAMAQQEQPGQPLRSVAWERETLEKLAERGVAIRKMVRDLELVIVRAPSQCDVGFISRSLGVKVSAFVPLDEEAEVLLWIDDFKTGLEMYSVMFEQLGYRVLTASSGEEGLSIAAKRHVDLVVTDYEMPGMTGEAVAASLKALHPDLPIVLFSGSTTVPFRALQVVDAYCDKAGSREELLAAIHFLLQKKRPAFLQPPPVAQASDDRQRTVA